MTTTLNVSTITWPLWRKVIFRFFFVLLLLEISPWGWLDNLPGVYYVTKYPDVVIDWAVKFTNTHFFHVRPTLIYPNGSGDTSYGWARLWFILSISIIGCMIWSLTDSRRKNYTILNYWLCLIVRYFIAINAFIYGIEKMFAMQMFFPNLHQLATPLGDFLPMRLSWMFIGYSKTYQVFSGFMEVVAGCLLLYRRTTTLGVLVATGVFLNVMMLNLSYDIPVKLFSIQLVVCCLFLLANESDRIICFFLLDKPASTCNIYYYDYSKKWMRITRVILKVVFILVFVGYETYNVYGYYKQSHRAPDMQAFDNGIYNVTSFSLKKEGKTVTMPDSLTWKDVIIEDGTGSAKTADTTFRQRYKRGYFFFKTNFKDHILDIKKLQDDSLFITHLKYTILDSGHIKLQGLFRKDSLFVDLKKINHPFQLSERQFHWLSEHNR